ncbi:MAG: hypothetical protein KA247_02330 [Bacteroidetes bacterium]|nr:hypothetical protein [Bacteroidota bacterium]
MNTKLLMTVSALLMLAAGIAITFLPQEILAHFTAQPNQELRLTLQILGAFYFAFGMVNWLAKESLLGGIYGRPIVVGNVTHFLIGALALIKGITLHNSILLWAAAGVYVLFAVSFTVTMYTQPKQKQ